MDIEDKEVLNYMKKSHRFRQGINKKRWFILDKNGAITGLMWFKYALNGWRLHLYTDKSDEEWKGRDAIKSVDQLTKYL